MNINLTLIAQAIGFAIFVWFTAKFVWPPLMRAIETRQKQIADGLAAGEQGRQNLVNAEQNAAQITADARRRAAEIVAQGEKQHAETVDRARTDAQAQAERIIASARAEIEQEVSRAREALRDQVAALAVAGASRILKREVDAQAHADLLAELERQL